MRKTSVRLFIAVATLSCGASLAQTPAPPDFAGAAVAQAYRGPAKLPDFRGRDRAFSGYRTRLRDAARDGVTFAGRYAVAEIGCGSGCMFAFMIDLSTGRVAELPFSGEAFPSLTLAYRADSALLRGQWDEGEGCATQDAVWNGRAFQKRAKTVSIEKC